MEGRPSMRASMDAFAAAQGYPPKRGGIAEDVHDQLLDDFPEDKLDWILERDWKGPLEVPLSAIDFSNRAKWRASKEPDKVRKFAEWIKTDDHRKPIVLVRAPGSDKYEIIDGHHRALAYEFLDEPATAYVTDVPNDDGPWTELHLAQRGGEKSQVSGTPASVMENGR
jgi:hypothetical protein